METSRLTQTFTPTFVVSDTRTLVIEAIRAAGKLVKLDRRRGWAALNELFRAGTLPDPLPEGRYAGELIALDLAPGFTQLVQWVASVWMLWKGKVFDRGHARGDNILVRNSRPLFRLLSPLYRGYKNDGAQTYRAFAFHTYVGAGRTDADRQVLKLDYDLQENPRLWVRPVLDELVEVADGVYLGKAHVKWWWGKWHTFAYFTLAREEESAQPSRMRLFDPRKVAYFEKENYVAYYQRRWSRLMAATVLMVKEAFGLNLLQAIYGAYLIASAEFAWAPKNHDLTVVEKKLRRFYRFVKRVNREDFDVSQATQHELEWWIAHRELFGEEQNGPVVDAFTNLYAALFQVEPARVREAAYYRAQAVLYSDWWVREGLDPDSPRLMQEEQAFVKSYTLLRQVVESRSRRS